MNIVVLNTKGGVGKSTIATQLIVPYLYDKYNKIVDFYEFDDENDDNEAFCNSQIINNIPVKVEKTDLREKVVDILINDSNNCVDIGANKSAKLLYNAIIESGMISAIDLIVIPMMDGEVDAISAINLYLDIRKTSQSVNILFILNRVNKNRDLYNQFEIFLGDNSGVFESAGLIENIQEDDRHYILVEDSDAIKQSRKFALTVYELAIMKMDLDAKIRQALKDGSTKMEIKTLSFKKRVQYDCVEFKKYILDKAFKDIDTLIGDGAEKNV
jgi:hypothetical protein